MKRIYVVNLVLLLAINGYSQPPTTNLRVWYDADVNVSVNLGGEVTGWQDNSGNGFNASTLLTGATLETVQGNDGINYSFVRFLGNSFLSSSYGGSGTGNTTIFIVFNNAENSSHAIHFRNINDSVVYPSANFRDKYGVEISTDPNTFDKSIGSGVTGKNFEVVAFRYERNRQTAGVSTWRNGMMLSGRTAPDLPLPALPLYIGGYANATQSILATADIAQVIIYDDALDETNMQLVYAYLSDRYNIIQNQYPFTNILEGDWSDPMIWAGGTVPDASDDVIIAPTGPAEWVSITSGIASCRNLVILENAGLRAYYSSDLPVLNVGAGNGNNSEFTVKGSFSLDSAELNLDGNWYVSSNKSDTLSEGMDLLRGSKITIDGNNGDPAESVSGDKALVDIRFFNDFFSSTTRLSSYTFGKINMTIVDPHLDANGITIGSFSGSYIISPIENAAYLGTLQFGDGVSTQSSDNPKGFVVSGDNFFPMKVIANSDALNNRGVTTESSGFITYHAGLKINPGASFTTTGYISLNWDLENNGTYIQQGGINISTLPLHNDSLAIKGTGIFNLSDIFSPVSLVLTGANDPAIKKIGIYAPLTTDFGVFFAPGIRVYLHQSLTLNYCWQKSLMEEASWSIPDPSYLISAGGNLVNNLPPVPVDTLRFYIGLEDVFAPVIIANHGAPGLIIASVRPGVTNAPNKPDLLDFEWEITQPSPGGNRDLIFQWGKTKELHIPDTTTLVVKQLDGGTWLSRTTQSDQNSFYPGHRQVTATGISSLSIFSIGASPLVTLPVDLLTFDAEKKEQTTLLTWKTAQEENSRSFVLERATDANRFIPIGTVAAAGNTTSITNYSFTDIHPVDGVNYYRLKQVDIDGQFTYSKTIPVNFGTPDKMLVSPNPATNQLNIKLPKNKRYTSLSIIDASGKVVLQQTITGSVVNIPLDIQRLPKGWYVLNITGDDSQQQAFLKQ